MALPGFDSSTMKEAAVAPRRRLRRKAHWRWQRYGPGRCLKKRIRIKASYDELPVDAPVNLELPL